MESARDGGDENGFEEKDDEEEDGEKTEKVVEKSHPFCNVL